MTHNSKIFVLAFVVTRRGALDIARAGRLLWNRGRAGDGWGGISSLISEIQQNPYVSFSSFKIDNWTENIIDLPGLKSMLVSNAKHITDCLERVRGRFFRWDRGMLE